ncbi:MAG: hypothetical protein JJ892_03955 [Balneola sp.]|nr:hypothetical protein [Balneola sp.]MBO6651609.1 hypothetical protein [Balneola sp.]MBO6710725.1 hypothetical protein [Balneola sp.]MBO6799411.1 hypothetical protein [Balneola sp.]MBO6869460.1 hypothetical protein [Balneola sp.]
MKKGDKSIVILAAISIIVIGASLTLIFNSALKRGVQYTEKTDFELYHEFSDTLEVFVKSENKPLRGAFCKKIFCGEDDFISELPSSSEKDKTEVSNFKSGDRLVIRRMKLGRDTLGLALSLSSKKYTIVAPLTYTEYYPDYLELVIQVDGLITKPEISPLHVTGHICDPSKPGCDS